MLKVILDLSAARFFWTIHFNYYNFIGIHWGENILDGR